MKKLKIIPALLIALSLGIGAIPVFAFEITVPTPFGPYLISIPDPPTGPGQDQKLLNAIRPSLPDPLAIFTAPLPVGSGARALGLAGAFTAIADDATAASWNPAGLIQLERPEISAVGLFSVDCRHLSPDNPDFSIDDSRSESGELNYASAVLPFGLFEKNFVASLNFQQVFDFAQSFSIFKEDRSSRDVNLTENYNYPEIVTRYFDDGLTEATIVIDLDTQAVRDTRGAATNSTLQDVKFDQDGALYALSPALAFEITPRLSVGAACNFFGDDPFKHWMFKSTTISRYSGSSIFNGTIDYSSVTRGSYSYTGRIRLPESNECIPISGKGAFDPIYAESGEDYSSRLDYEGEFRRENEFKNAFGVNGTFGLLWNLTAGLTIGATVDLPYTVKGEQETVTTSRITIYDPATGEKLEDSEEREESSQTIKYYFPLYWAFGAAYRWSDAFTTALDVSQTLWSDYKYKLEDGTKLNPLDGQPYGETRVDDTWAIRAGAEYLIITEKTEIPLRGGIFWEQRPALGSPDNYLGLSLGSGFSLGKDPGKLIFDLAYIFTYGHNVLRDIFPSEPDLSADLFEHQIMASLIFHF